MSLKNTYTKLPARKHIADAQDALMKVGASGIQMEFEETRVSGLSFTIRLGPNPIQFRLPIHCRKFQEVLRKEGNKKYNDDDYAYRVAWACAKDWIEAQVAFIESENVTLPQVFLPYAVTKEGNTLFEKVAESGGQFLLGSGE